MPKHAKSLRFWSLILRTTLLAGAPTLFAQPANFEVRRVALSSVGGRIESSNFTTYFLAGQASPTETSESANCRDAGGFLAFLGVPKTGGQLIATASCPPAFAKECSVNVDLSIDLTGTIPEARLESFAGHVSWDPALLAFVRHSGLLSGFAGRVNTDSVEFGKLVFEGSNATGSAGVAEVLNIDFAVIGNIGESDVVAASFSTMTSTSSSQNLIPLLALNDCAFTIIRSDLLGDVNGDSSINSTDALIILTFDAGVSLPPDILDRINAEIGDVNGDGLTNSTDALIILSFDVGIEVPFAVGKRFCP